MKKTIFKLPSVYVKCIILFLFLPFLLDAKIRILTFHYNKADFIEFQYKTLKKFLLEDHELIVFNDASDATNEIEIQFECQKYNLPCIRYDQEWHKTDPLNQIVTNVLLDPNIYSHINFRSTISNQPSIRHCHVIQYALDHFGYDHNDIVVILDGDAFPIRPLSLRALLAHHPIIGIQKFIPEDDISYLWVPFIAMDMRRMPNKHDLKFHVDVIRNKLYDTGAHTYHYLKNNPKVKPVMLCGHSSTSFYNMPPSEMYLHGFNDHEIELAKTLPWPNCVEFHFSHLFLHFGASAFTLEGHEIKSEYVKNFLIKILGES